MEIMVSNANFKYQSEMDPLLCLCIVAGRCSSFSEAVNEYRI